jgi:S1-C subfamily serine protease
MEKISLSEAIPVKSRKILILSFILSIGTSVSIVAQSKTNSSDDIVSVEPAIADLVQTPEAPQTPGAWSFSMADGNYLGVYTESVTAQNLGTYGVREARGVGINRVAKDSPAEKAGLQKNDVIIRFDNETVTSVAKLNRLIAEAEPGHTAQLTISRGGSEQQLSVKLGERSENKAGLFKWTPGDSDDLVRPFMNGQNFNFDQEGLAKLYNVFGSTRRIGVSTAPLSKQLGEYFGAQNGGVLISTVVENGPAAKAGLKAGDVITAVDGSAVKSANEFIKELGNKKDGDVTLTIIRDKSQRTIKVTPETNASPTVLDLMDMPQVGTLVEPKVVMPVEPVTNGISTPRIRVIPHVQVPVTPAPVVVVEPKLVL